MKVLINESTPLTLNINGATVTPDLARPYTKKQNGHHVTLRVTHARQVLAYLATDIYVMPHQFNAKTKQLADSDLNLMLQSLLSRAGKVVGSTLVPAQLKASWERERVAQQGEDVVEAMETFADWHKYSELTRRAEWLEKELVLVHNAMKKMEAEDPGLAPVPVASLVERKDFVKAIDAFMEERKDTVKERDYQMWESWKLRLEECAQHSNIVLTLLNIDMKFYAKYKSYLMVTRGNKLSTFGAHVKRLKSFMKWAEQNGYTVGKGHKNDGFAITEEAKTVVYLDDKELDMLWAYKQVKPEYAKQIDLCLFQSLTGLRISDTAKVHHVTKQTNDDGETVEYLTGTCKKTGGLYKVPLSLDSRIKEILTANKNNMALITEAYYNRSIKEIVAELYAFHGVVMPTVIVNREDAKGAVHETITPKNEELGTHSNRRSFVSRHINSSEFNHTDVLAMLGSSDMKELQKYIQVHDKALDDKAKANAKTRASKR
ncbi:phage integrase SAM-like domain-containing protein [Hymenobacter daeguensis]